MQYIHILEDSSDTLLKCNSLLGLLLVLGGMVSQYFLNHSIAMAGSHVSYGYDLILNGNDVGDLSTTRKQDLNDETLLVQTSFTLKLAGWFGNYDLTSSGEVIVDRMGILKFDNIITEDGQTFRLVGERHNEELWCSAKEVFTQKEQEDVAVVDLAVSVATTVIPYAGGSLSVVSLLDNKNSGRGELRIPMTLFDTSATILSTFLVENKDSMTNRSVRILDTTDLSIETVEVNKKGQEQITVAEQTFKCHVFDVKTSEGQSVYWIAEDLLDPFLVKETGKDTDGDYEVRLKEYIIHEGIE